MYLCTHRWHNQFNTPTLTNPHLAGMPRATRSQSGFSWRGTRRRPGRRPARYGGRGEFVDIRIYMCVCVDVCMCGCEAIKHASTTQPNQPHQNRRWAGPRCRCGRRMTCWTPGSGRLALMFICLSPSHLYMCVCVISLLIYMYICILYTYTPTITHNTLPPQPPSSNRRALGSVSHPRVRVYARGTIQSHRRYGMFLPFFSSLLSFPSLSLSLFLSPLSLSIRVL